MDRLNEIFMRQLQLQQLINGYALSKQDNDTRINNIKENVLACTAELHEALNEVGWKAWATTRHINQENLQKEIIDAFHFLLNLALHAGMDSQEFFRRFVEKNDLNYARQSIGYDGKAEKCPHCARALDDVGVGESRVLGELAFECGHCHQTLTSEQVLGSSLLTKMIRAAKIMNQT